MCSFITKTLFLIRVWYSQRRQDKGPQLSPSVENSVPGAAPKARGPPRSFLDAQPDAVRTKTLFFTNWSGLNEGFVPSDTTFPDFDLQSSGLQTKPLTRPVSQCSDSHWCFCVSWILRSTGCIKVLKNISHDPSQSFSFPGKARCRLDYGTCRKYQLTQPHCFCQLPFFILCSEQLRWDKGLCKTYNAQKPSQIQCRPVWITTPAENSNCPIRIPPRSTP